MIPILLRLSIFLTDSRCWIELLRVHFKGLFMNHNLEMLNLPSKKAVALHIFTSFLVSQPSSVFIKSKHLKKHLLILVFKSKFRNFVEFGMNLCFTEI